jgi:serine phosphatase RsbU (regulator of sigma subunit)
LVFDPGSIPHLVYVAGVLGLLVVAMLARGDTLIRSAMFAATLISLPWAGGTALILNVQDAATVAVVGRFFTGVWTLFGSACLLFALSVVGQLERRRSILMAATAVALLTCVLTWSTDLVVDGARELAWGTYYPAAGPLYPLHIGNLAFGSAASLFFAFRSLGNKRVRPVVRYAMVLGVGTAVGSLDVLLAYGLAPYPISTVSGLAVVLIVMVAIPRYDLLRIRGLDRAGAYELGIVAILMPLVITATWAALPGGLGGGVVLALVMLLPLFGGAQAATLMVRQHMTSERAQLGAEHGLALERFVEDSGRYRSDPELEDALIGLLEHVGGMREVRLFITDAQGALRRQNSSHSASLALSERLRNWLVAHPEPIDARELNTRRLGQVREPLETLLARIGSDVIVPLVDRDVLVGMIAATPRSAERALDDTELQLLQEGGRSAARALTFISLFREAEARIELEKELEVADAVQHARTPGEIRNAYDTCVVVGHYRPAARFGGDWWTSHQLPDDRVLVVIGDVSGRGVPAALVSSTAAAACQTAQQILGASCEVLSLLELLNDAVLSVGGDQYGMSCFAALLDLDSRRLSFAGAGYPFPYLCRQHPADPEVAELFPLISRGTPLGTVEPMLRAATIDVQEGDMIVFVSDAVAEAQDKRGRRYGERRLQHVLRRQLLPAGERACTVLLDDVLSHCGDRPIADDLIVVVVRVGKPEGR